LQAAKALSLGKDPQTAWTEEVTVFPGTHFLGMLFHQREVYYHDPAGTRVLISVPVYQQ
jgi:hypothetical protein